MKIIDRLRRKRDFRALIADSRPRLYRTAYAWCHSPDLADDLVQQTIVKALQSYAQLREISAMNGWLFRIMARCLVDHKRMDREIPSDLEIWGVEEYTPEDAAIDDQLVARVRGAVRRLPLEQRQVVSLVDLEGFSYADVASVLDVPVGTVMSRLSRARRVLHRQLIAQPIKKSDIRNDRVRRVK